jgi:hypothetical protein
MVPVRIANADPDPAETETNKKNSQTQLGTNVRNGRLEIRISVKFVYFVVSTATGYRRTIQCGFGSETQLINCIADPVPNFFYSGSRVKRNPDPGFGSA